MGHLIARLDGEFAELYTGWCELVQQLDAEKLYQTSPIWGRSCGEHLVRSARIVEQTFGGITANLWDDPFEWTLPETLPTPQKVTVYFEEVEATRKRGFDLFKTDDDLRKEIMGPAGETQLFSLLLDTLQRARHHHQRAIAVFDALNAGYTDD